VGRGGVLVAPSLSSCPYSPDCVEDAFSEVRLEVVLHSSGHCPAPLLVALVGVRCS
jgi:hypothetical protein